MKTIYLIWRNLRKIFSILLILFLCNIFISDSFAYDRGKAIQYLDTWWDTDLDDNDSHEHINTNGGYTYYPYDPVTETGGDCANFASQVLIAGGIRFGSYGYGQGGAIPGAENLRQNLKSQHGAIEYSYLDNSIKEGDIIFVTDFDETPDADHTLIVRSRTGNEVYVSAHTDDRPGTRNPEDKLSEAFAEDTLVYLHIPDSPIAKHVQIQQNYQIKYHGYHSYETNQLVVPTSEIVGEGEIKVKILFDTPMKTDSNSISFSKLPYSAKNFQPDGGTNGWTTTFYSNDTWNGKYAIPANACSEYDGENYISIFARGLDNSPIDPDEDLTLYNLSNTSSDILHHFTISTTPPEWAGTFDNVDKETNPGNLILAKTQGGNNFDYVYTCD
ncbi:MAG: hypothetical protein A2551_08090, partial [Elusimicrobia bacterium RIFOXYD2_FULL_34_30]